MGLYATRALRRLTTSLKMWLPIYDHSDTKLTKYSTVGFSSRIANIPAARQCRWDCLLAASCAALQPDHQPNSPLDTSAEASSPDAPRFARATDCTHGEPVSKRLEPSAPGRL